MATNHSPNQQFLGVPGGRYELSTPALLLDLDALERNIQRMAEYCQTRDRSLRPHSKSHKSPEIARRQADSGAVGICCATVREAEAMVNGGVAGVLITSPVVGRAKIARLMALHRMAPDLMVVADDPANVADLQGAVAAAETGHALGVLVDLDVGTHRTGVVDANAAVALAHEVAAAPDLAFAGVQAYYGHVQHIAGFDERAEAAVAAAAPLREAVLRLDQQGLKPGIVSGGGTGTHDIDLAAGPYTELQAGSYIFTDVEYNAVALRREAATPFEPALFVQASVVSNRHHSHAVIDAGLKSFATDGPPPAFHQGAPAGASYRFMGDEHGAVVYGGDGERLPLGAVVACVVPHCDPTVNLYDCYHCVRGDTLVDLWPVAARGNP